MIRLWTVLGLVGIKVKFQASSGFWFQLVEGLCSCGQQFSSGEGSASCKNDLGMCVRPLSIFLSGNWSLVILLCCRIIV